MIDDLVILNFVVSIKIGDSSLFGSKIIVVKLFFGKNFFQGVELILRNGLSDAKVAQRLEHFFLSELEPPNGKV